MSTQVLKGRRQKRQVVWLKQDATLLTLKMEKVPREMKNSAPDPARNRTGLPEAPEGPGLQCLNLYPATVTLDLWPPKLQRRILCC